MDRVGGLLNLLLLLGVQPLLQAHVMDVLDMAAALAQADQRVFDGGVRRVAVFTDDLLIIIRMFGERRRLLEFFNFAILLDIKYSVLSSEFSDLEFDPTDLHDIELLDLVALSESGKWETYRLFEGADDQPQPIIDWIGRNGRDAELFVCRAVWGVILFEGAERGDALVLVCLHFFLGFFDFVVLPVEVSVLLEGVLTLSD